MEWHIIRGKPREPGKPSEERQPFGKLKFPARPATPGYDIYRSTLVANDWAEAEEGLAGFWLKLCDVLPRYYDSEASRKQWDRIVCMIKMETGMVSAGAWRGNEQPAGLGRVIVAVNLPLVSITCAGLPHFEADYGEWKKGLATLRRATVSALAHSAVLQLARTKLAELRAWHRFEVFTMQDDDKSTMQRLK